ncbi:hypothetical protein KHO57_gp019 [Mycobacterium phage Phabba]|uniref:Uncharacterized protein n=1 Tax=Mycobacterium phage Phabba TaxID=2027899 RepID=A0A249XTR2_9CAUD|nr:hypothetical protein KHO57_gp019 [Mycobacterium phage Phabba]ASZ74594.1 hypothetical protein SEA_PHABBA_19 [Mycobacterium phage Phabba]
MSHAVEEFHQEGSLGISNLEEVLYELNLHAESGEQVDVGLQVSHEGRIWLCVNGMALIRFKPNMAQMHVRR